MNIFFGDTKKELFETYSYLNKLENVLGFKINRVGSEQGFDFILNRMNGYLPSPNARWCTRELKIKPIERYLGNEDVIHMYIGIRADEDRLGYITSKNNNIIPEYPLREAGMGINDVTCYLNKCGVGIPSYYDWRTRSGCYFCFFQRKSEWYELYKRHPRLYFQAMEYEKYTEETISYNSEINGAIVAVSHQYEKPVFKWRTDKSLKQLKIVFDKLMAAEEATKNFKQVSIFDTIDKLPSKFADIAKDFFRNDYVDGLEPCTICSE